MYFCQAAPEISLRLAGQLGGYWRLRHDLEGLQWLDAALRVTGNRAPLTDRARAQLHHAGQLQLRNDGAAIEGFQAALALYREANDHAGMSETLSALAPAVGVFADDLAGERRYAQEACRHARIVGDHGLLGRALGKLAAVAAAQGRDETAARLRGASHALGYPPVAFDKRIDDRLERDYLAAARTRYGDIAWRADEQAGARLSREQAIAYALGERSEAIQPHMDERCAKAVAYLPSSS